MTIVLQHQYWDLVVTEQLFEVGLSFGEIAEKLVIPFSAIRGFYDPSVNFELEFDVSVALPTGDNDTDNLEIVSELRPQDESIATDDTETAAKPAKKPAKKADRSKTAAKDDSTETAETEEEAAKPSADVVSLDAFRKK